jgi:PrcB C-terminal
MAHRLAVLIVAAAIVSACGAESRPVAYTDLTADVGPLDFTRIKRQLFRERSDLVEFLAEQNPGRRLRLPPIDFTRQQVYVVATGPRSSTGYDLRIVRVRDEGDHIVVVVRERTPSLGDDVEPRVTFPFRMIALPRTDEPVRLKWLGRP